MKKNIVFDMGNVLIKYDAKKYAENYTFDEVSSKLLYHEIFCSTEWLKMDRGVLSSKEAIASIQGRVPTSLHTLVEQLIKDWHKEIPPYPEMEELVAELKELGYHIYLLSNTSSRFHEFRVNIPALKYFDGEFISADCNLLKPDFAIFHAFYEHFGLNPKECFFIDDSAANIEAAEVTGMEGFVYHGDIAKLKKKLVLQGIQIKRI